MAYSVHFDGVGFAVGDVRGVRAWDCRDDGILTGVVYHQPWLAGENIALCRKYDSETFMMPGIPVPAATVVAPIESTADEEYKAAGPRHIFGCQCGFYAYFDGSNDYYKGDYSMARRLCGVVQGYGDVLVGSRGFRATRARILALYISDEFRGRVDLLRANYPEVAFFDSFAAMIAEYPQEDGGAMEEHRRMEAEKAEATRRARLARMQLVPVQKNPAESEK